MMKNYLAEARKNHHAVGAFNFGSFEDLRAIVMAAEETGVEAVMLMSNQKASFNLGVEMIAGYVRALREQTKVKLILHLDHGKDMDLIRRGIKAGYDSVMYDGSGLPFEENIANTRKIADLCHDEGILVEGELGQVPRGAGSAITGDSQFTDPALVAEFVERASVDSLAVAIGNVHGLYKGVPMIHFDILEKIGQETDVPLVLHGGTGIAFEDLRKGVSMGIAKVNVGTALRVAHAKASLDYFSVPGNIDPEDASHAIRQAVKAVVVEHINAFCK